MIIEDNRNKSTEKIKSTLTKLNFFIFLKSTEIFQVNKGHNYESSNL